MFDQYSMLLFAAKLSMQSELLVIISTHKKRAKWAKNGAQRDPTAPQKAL
jgi:hypothetical protein